MIAEGVLVVQRMLASRFVPQGVAGHRPQAWRAGRRPAGRTDAPFYRASAEVMAEVVGFHLNRGVLAAAPRPAELSMPRCSTAPATIAVLEGVNDHENLGSIFRNAAGLGVDAVVFGHRVCRPAVPPGGAGVDGARAAGALRLGRRAGPMS